ncbi:branched-chain amino acid ABC transporter permease [Brevibacillus massiliensis]|uniref:branched-chain amino acid ABC transporter permease n=1 Tax=Brevibacillus massiliensis TaxID=1118054 RepID=UPI0003061FD0|nr:branched-chain amino acid ABC transporter permease [Brevibacillus massiliensis]
MDILAIQLVNGLSYGLLLFMITSGLSLIFGIMGVLNLAHGSLYMVGAYLALGITKHVAPSFFAALLLAPLLVALFSVILEVGLLRPTYRLGHLSQVLLTFGLAYVVHDLVRWIWGSSVQSLSIPASLGSSVELFGQTFPIYRLAVMGFGLIVAAAMWFFQEKTRWGAIIRAGLSNREMVGGLGINITVVFTVVFAIGGLLAGIGGVAAAPILGLFPGMEFEVLILALVILVVGGLGSITGTLAASMIIGVVDTFGKVMFPQLSLMIIFGLMALVLIVKPTGLLGKQVN